MKIQYKAETWFEIELSDEVSAEEIKAVIGNTGLVEDFNDLDNYGTNEILETCVSLTPEENDGQPTIEWRDGGEVVWDNVNGYHENE